MHAFEMEFLLVPDATPETPEDTFDGAILKNIKELYCYAVQQHYCRILKRLSLDNPRRLYWQIVDNFSADSEFLVLLPLVYQNKLRDLHKMVIRFADTAF